MKTLGAAKIIAVLIMTAWFPCQQALMAATGTQVPAPNPSDVGTVDGIIQALYQVISGPVGQKRDWDRFRSLFAPDARLIPALVRTGEKPVLRVLDVEAYIRRVEPFFEKEGFWETEKERKLDTAGNLVHAFSTYESRHQQNGEPFQTGVNSIQLFSDGTRWWIVTVMWNSSR